MVKFVYCVHRRLDFSPADFKKYWIEKHGPLVKSCAAVMRARRYVQSHTIDSQLNEVVRQPRGASEPFDGITEIWWDSIEDVIAASASTEGQKANQLLAEDEARFCDLSRSSVFFTEEHTVF